MKKAMQSFALYGRRWSCDCADEADRIISFLFFVAIWQIAVVDREGGEYAQLAEATSRQRRQQLEDAGVVRANAVYADIDHRVGCNHSMETSNSKQSVASIADMIALRNEQRSNVRLHANDVDQ